MKCGGGVMAKTRVTSKAGTSLGKPAAAKPKALPEARVVYLGAVPSPRRAEIRAAVKAVSRAQKKH
jgi:hypothetical protein